MKRRTKIIFITVLAVTFLVSVSFGAVWAISSYFVYQYASLHDGCSPHHMNYVIVIKDNKATPSTTTANRCDSLTITNRDTVSRMIAFGLHDNHAAYDGVIEQALVKDQSFTVTMIQTGTFKIHDHAHDEVQAIFQVQ